MCYGDQSTCACDNTFTEVADQNSSLKPASGYGKKRARAEAHQIQEA